MHGSYQKQIRAAVADYTDAAAGLQDLSYEDLHTLEDARQLGVLRERLADAQVRLNRVIMEMRARITTDAHIVDGMDFLAIGEQLGMSNNAPANWRNDHGPKMYFVIYPPRGENPRYALGTVPPRQREVRAALSNGAVLIPARVGFDLLSGGERAGLDLADWYARYRHTAEYARRPS